MNRLARAWIRVASALAALAVLPTAAHAHGALRGAVPARGAHLSVAPTELRLTFTEDVELAVARLELLGPDSTVVRLAPLSLAPDSANVLVARIAGPLVAGAYSVFWQVAGADGHPVRGSYLFVIAPGATGLARPAGPPAPGGAPPPASHHSATSLPSGEGFDAGSPLYVVVRWLTFLGLVGVIGAVAFRAAVLPRARRRDADAWRPIGAAVEARAAGAGLLAAVVVMAAAIQRLVAQSYALHGAAGVLDGELVTTMLGRTLWGWGWLLQAAAALVALLGFAWARRGSGAVLSAEAETAPAESAEIGAERAEEPATPRTPARTGSSRVGWIVAGFAALVLAFTPALAGHAASTPRLTGLAVVADALHVLGAGGWIGGLLLVVTVAVPATASLPGDLRIRAVAAVVNAFTPTALLFAGTLAATGVFAAALHLGGIGALFASAYGKTLLIKLAVLSVVLATGAHNWLRVRPALGEEGGTARLRRSAVLEIATGVLVLLVTAVLVATAAPATM